MILNAIKHIAKVEDSVLLIAQDILKPIQDLKKMLYGDKEVLLDTHDVLLALAVCAASDEVAKLTLSKLQDLRNVQAHSTYIFTNGEEGMYRNLKICITSEPNFMTKRLYFK